MVKQLSLLVFVSAFSALKAQPILVKNTKSNYKNAATPILIHSSDKYRTGFEAENGQPTVPKSASARALGYSIGTTTYDLASNGCVKHRLYNFGSGKLSGAFNYGKSDVAAGFPERGSGYNTTTNGKFGAAPTKRVETERTGFTTLAVDGDGNEYLFAHKSGYKIVLSKKNKGANTWIQSEIPTQVPGGVLWSSAAIGGTNKKTLHVIALTTPTNTAGGVAPYQGIDGNIVYFRSQDGGTTWDKTDVTLPGLDNTRYNALTADAYSITAKGDKVVIASFGSFSDTEIWTSLDNGTTFSRKTIFDFPLENYKIDDLYTVDDIPQAPEGLDPLAIQSTDGSGHIYIDDNNKTHLIVGEMYYVDKEVDDKAYTYYPGIEGFLYWNETEPDSLRYIGNLLDLDNDGEVKISSGAFGIYYNALTCHPSMTMGADGTLYLVYSAPAENYFSDATGKTLRHIFIIYSKDKGVTWSKPYDIIDDESVFDANNFIKDGIECTFPYVAQGVDDNLHIIYQADYTPGMHVSHPDTETIDAEDNDQIYVAVPTAKITKSKDIIAATQINYTLSPNPATNGTFISYSLNEMSNVKVAVLDITGKVIYDTDLGTQQQGENSHFLPLNSPAGMYFVQLSINNKKAVNKLIIR